MGHPLSIDEGLPTRRHSLPQIETLQHSYEWQLPTTSPPNHNRHRKGIARLVLRI
jgi:hypothetical protein